MALFLKSCAVTSSDSASTAVICLSTNAVEATCRAQVRCALKHSLLEGGIRESRLKTLIFRYAGKCGEKNCPQFCLACEVCCCFPASVQSTRFLLQDELGLANSKCDNCLIATMIFLQYLACICEIIACISGDDGIQSLAEIIRCIADCVYCSVCACMQTQHKVQVTRHRD